MPKIEISTLKKRLLEELKTTEQLRDAAMKNSALPAAVELYHKALTLREVIYVIIPEMEKEL